MTVQLRPDPFLTQLFFVLAVEMLVRICEKEQSYDCSFS